MEVQFIDKEIMNEFENAYRSSESYVNFLQLDSTLNLNTSLQLTEDCMCECENVAFGKKAKALICLSFWFQAFSLIRRIQNEHALVRSSQHEIKIDNTSLHVSADRFLIPILNPCAMRVQSL